MKMPRFSRVLACLAAMISVLVAGVAAANDHTAPAIAQFESRTLPALTAMAPFINKSPAERAQAFADLPVKRAACATAASEAYGAKDKLAYAAAYDCQMLTYWLANTDVSACRYLIWTREAYDYTWPTSKKVEEKFAAAGLADVHDRLVSAMACEKTSRLDWGQKAVGTFKALHAEYQQSKSRWASLDTKASAEAVDPCYHAVTLSADVSPVSEAANSGCAVLWYLTARNDQAAACDKVQAGVNRLDTVATDTPLEPESGTLKFIFLGFDTYLKCGTRFPAEYLAIKAASTPKAADPAAAPVQNARTPQMQQVYDLKAEGIGYENQANEYRGYARGMVTNAYTKSACEAYIKAAGFMNKASGAYSRGYTLILTAHLDISSDEFVRLKTWLYARAADVSEARSDLKEEAAEVCEAAGMKIY